MPQHLILEKSAKEKQNTALTKRLIYITTKETAQLCYGHITEPVARGAYIEHLKSIHPDATVSETGLHDDLKVPCTSL